jgi:hypothetical protein
MPALCLSELERDLSAQRPTPPPLSHREIYGIAQMFRDDPATTLKLADEYAANWSKSMSQPYTRVKCDRCDGHGMRTVWSFGVKEPDECPDCGGGGTIIRYASGRLASYPGGPFLGNDPAPTKAEGRS